jgi:hypothetical protein
MPACARAGREPWLESLNLRGLVSCPTDACAQLPFKGLTFYQGKAQLGQTPDYLQDKALQGRSSDNRTF